MEMKHYEEIVLRLTEIENRLGDLVNTSSLSDCVSTAYNNSTRSPDLKDLFGALAKAQAIMPAVSGNKENPYFKERYIDLGDMVRVSRPALTKYGLAVIQQILPNDDGQMILHTILSHESGQWIESRIRIIPPKNDLRTLDSYITNLKRCAYGSLVGIVGKDDDDDGEYATATTRETFAKGTALNTKYNPKENKLETISRDQIDELEYELSDYPDIAEDVLDGLKIQNLANMPKEKFLTSINRIRKIKRTREGNL